MFEKTRYTILRIFKNKGTVIKIKKCILTNRHIEEWNRI